MEANSDIGILIFARNANCEAHVKAFGKSFHSNQKAHQKLLDHTLHIVKETTLPYSICTERDQHGSTFGERLSNAIDHALKSFQQIIVLGSDCPDLNLAHVQQAKQNCMANTVTLGSTPSGGVYLLTINRSHWNKDKFQHLRWQTHHIFSNLLYDYFQSDADILEELHDINGKEDIKFVVHKDHYVYKCLKVFIEVIYQDLLCLHLKLSRPSNPNLNTGLNYRGPPVL